MSKEYVIVIDTTVIVSAFLFEKGFPYRIFKATYEHHTLLFSAKTYAELYEVLLRPKFDKYALTDERMLFLQKFLKIATEVSVHTDIQRCRDPKDDKFLALAIDGEADYLISSDRDLLDMNTINGIPILSPREFYESVIEE